MKLKIVTIDLELSTLQKRGCLVAASLLLATVTASLAFAVPQTFTPGETLTAADLNANFKGLDERATTLEGARVSVTPWVGADAVVKAGNSAVSVTADGAAKTMHWRRVGDSVEVNVTARFPTCMPPGGLSFSLPPGLNVDYAKTGSYGVLGAAAISHSSSTLARGFVLANAAGQPDVVFVDVADSDGVDVACSDIGSNGWVRFQFTSPIVGWNVYDAP